MYQRHDNESTYVTKNTGCEDIDVIRYVLDVLRLFFWALM